MAVKERRGGLRAWFVKDEYVKQYNLPAIEIPVHIINVFVIVIV